MATEEATQKESAKINPAENLDGWLTQRDAGKESGTQTKTSAAQPEETVAESPAAVQPPSWRDTVIGDDVEHGFFKQKKVGEVVKSFQHAERAKQDAERERNEWRQKAEQLQREREAEAAARRVAAESQPKPPSEDEEIARLWFDNPQLAAQKLREKATSDARKQVAEEAQRVYQENQRKDYEAYVMKTGPNVYKAAQTDLGLTDDDWYLRAPAVYHHFTDPKSPFYGDGGNALRKEAVIDLYNRIYPKAAAPVVAKPVTEPPAPPGAKRPSSISNAEPEVSPLSRERQSAIKTFASIGGVDPKGLEARQVARKRGENRG